MHDASVVDAPRLGTNDLDLVRLDRAHAAVKGARGELEDTRVLTVGCPPVVVRLARDTARERPRRDAPVARLAADDLLDLAGGRPCPEMESAVDDLPAGCPLVLDLDDRGLGGRLRGARSRCLVS